MVAQGLSGQRAGGGESSAGDGDPVQVNIQTRQDTKTPNRNSNWKLQQEHDERHQTNDLTKRGDCDESL